LRGCANNPNLDRFDVRSDFEMVATEAARLKVTPETIQFYRNRYGDETIIVTIKGLASRMPVFEFQIRRWILGERIHLVK
jgi:hypothetical protein